MDQFDWQPQFVINAGKSFAIIHLSLPPIPHNKHPIPIPNKYEDNCEPIPTPSSHNKHPIPSSQTSNPMKIIVIRSYHFVKG